MNKLAELAGVGERAYTKALRVLLDDPAVQPAVLEVLTRITPRLTLRPVLTVRREEMLAGGAIPDIVLESDSTFVLIESKLGAALTAKQRTEYLALVEQDRRATRALIFLVPEGDLRRYETELARLAGAGSLLEAQARLRSRGVVFHLLTWGEIAEELRNAIPSLGAVAGDWVGQFVEMVLGGPAGTSLDDDDDEPLKITPDEASSLADPKSARLIEIYLDAMYIIDDVVVELAEEHKCKRKWGGGISRFQLSNRRWKGIDEIRIAPTIDFWAKFGRSPIWATWVPQDLIEIELRTTVAVLNERGLHIEHLSLDEMEFDDEDEADADGDGQRNHARGYVFGMPLPLPETADFRRSADAYREPLGRLLRALGRSA